MSNSHILGISKNNLVIYSGTLTGIIILLGVCYCIHSIKKRSLKTMSNMSVNDEIVHTSNANVHAVPENIEMNDAFYHTIDESNMETTIFNRSSPYLEVIEGSSSSENISNSLFNTSSFPKSSNELKQKISVHQKNNMRCENETDDIGQNKTTNTANGEYENGNVSIPQNPCMALSEVFLESVRYQNTTEVVVHKDQSSNSDSENERVDNGNYLNPYVPLKPEFQRYKNAYEIPQNTDEEKTDDYDKEK